MYVGSLGLISNNVVHDACIITHQRQYPCGALTVISLNGRDLASAIEGDFCFGWLISPNKSHDSALVSLITINHGSLDYNIPVQLLKRLIFVSTHFIILIVRVYTDTDHDTTVANKSIYISY